MVGTGRSDFPNQINNVLAFPGVFRARWTRAGDINDAMKLGRPCPWPIWWGTTVGGLHPAHGLDERGCPVWQRQWRRQPVKRLARI